jgi:hypothetical protein
MSGKFIIKMFTSMRTSSSLIFIIKSRLCYGGIVQQPQIIVFFAAIIVKVTGLKSETDRDSTQNFKMQIVTDLI